MVAFRLGGFRGTGDTCEHGHAADEQPREQAGRHNLNISHGKLQWEVGS
jgi:hypothetical protein